MLRSMTGEVCSGMVQSNLRLQAFLMLGRPGSSKKGEVYKPNETSVGPPLKWQKSTHHQNSSAVATTTKEET